MCYSSIAHYYLKNVWLHNLYCFILLFTIFKQLAGHMVYNSILFQMAIITLLMPIHMEISELNHLNKDFCLTLDSNTVCF